MSATAIILLAALFWSLAYLRARTLFWVGLPALALIGLSLGGYLHGPACYGLWTLYLPVVGLYRAPGLRRQLLVRPLLKQFLRVMPPMSETEREALEAGSVWWDAELFGGRPRWQQLQALAAPRLTPEEQAFLDGPAEDLCRRLDDWDITHERRDLSPQIWDFIKSRRFFGMIVPREYGGLGFSAQAHSAVVMKLASRSITAAVTVMVPNSLGPAKLLLDYGTEQQRRYYLPRLARGAEIPCFALTGPQAGSDAAALPDVGVVCRARFDTRDGLGIRLSWDKRYTTLGPVATVLGLAFRLQDPEHLLGEQTDRGITLALIPTDTPGVHIGERHIPLDIPFQNGPSRGEDVLVPLDRIIGGPPRIGQGWRMLMECLAEGRGISLPALATGAGKAASRYAGAYAGVRRQFGQPIGCFEGVQEALGRIAGRTYQMDAARLLTLRALDSGERPSVISAIVKYHLTERYRQIVNDAMDIQGGTGVCLGPRNLLGRAYQAIPISITVEGANILTRSLIIFGQGAVRCHPFLLQEISAARDPDPAQALERFDTALFGHIGFLLGNLARATWLGLTRGRLSRAPGRGPVRRYRLRLNWLSAAFALSADLCLMTLGGALKRRERLSARLGDVLSQLYLASAVLKHFEDQGSPAADLPLLRWACEDALYGIQEAFRGLTRNLPIRPLGWLLRLLTFPTGMPFAPPDDRTTHRAARLLLTPGEARDRLTQGIYLSRDPCEPRGRLELALEQAVAVAPLEKTLRQARRNGLLDAADLRAGIAQALGLGLLTEAEANVLRSAERLRTEVTRVDAFADYGRRGKRREPARSVGQAHAA